MVKNADTADFTISLNGENGDEDVATLTLKSTSIGILSGEWVTQVESPVSASALWTEDPHIGFSFILEAGTITAVSEGQGTFCVTGTPLNDAYASYQSECKAVNHSKADSITELTCRSIMTPHCSEHFSPHIQPPSSEATNRR